MDGVSEILVLRGRPHRLCPLTEADKEPIPIIYFHPQAQYVVF